ncbi:YfiM family protein [Rhizorhabdus wittichii]|uniref:YfiM family protein n=1 Tax=Rhizorhabdus wittichii TaxID=160791 RepID=UPI0002F6C080|nr:YfiM family protein [Rhizorhabdus wittichii]
MTITDGLARPVIRSLATIAFATSAAPILADAIDENAPAIDFDLSEPHKDWLALAEQPVPAAEPGYGPSLPALPAAEEPNGQRLSFGRQVGAIKWELGAALVWVTGTNIAKVNREGGRRFHFQDEGWFGKDTINLGMDKLTHAWNTYWITDMIEARIRRKTGATNTGLTAASLSMGVMLYAELWDAHKKSSGFSFQDIAMNASGAGFSLLRNAVPGLDRKLDFRLLLIPNKDIYTPSGTRHYRQMRYLFALKLAGFEGLEDSPLRFVELHAGYRATGFTAKEEARGDPRRRRPFIGIGLNLNELFFPDRPSGWAGRAASEALQYVQVPYTAYHAD